MMVLVVLALVLGFVASGYCAIRTVRRRRTPQELRGDWWTGFEREFRAYASRVASQQTDRRRRGQRGPSGR